LVVGGGSREENGVGLPVDFILTDHASIGGTGRLRLFRVPFPGTRCRPFYGIRPRETDGGDMPSPAVGSLIDVRTVCS
jgi:hypothetical protein